MYLFPFFLEPLFLSHFFLVVDPIFLVVAVVLGQESAVLLALACLLRALRHVLNDSGLVVGEQFLSHFIEALAVSFNDYIAKLS